VALNTLVDSPVLAGRYFREIQLTPGKNPPHYIDIAADSEAALAMTPETEMHLHQLVAEAGALFGSRHYRDYHFLLTLSDDVAHFGLEHHESSDDRTAERSLIDETELLAFAGLLPHEYAHSWNGKYRRPEGLVTRDYQVPMKDDLLWVYAVSYTHLDVYKRQDSHRSGLFQQQARADRIAEIFSLRNRTGPLGGFEKRAFYRPPGAGRGKQAGTQTAVDGARNQLGRRGAPLRRHGSGAAGAKHGVARSRACLLYTSRCV